MLGYVEHFLLQILRLNDRQLFIYCLMTLVAVTVATLVALWFTTLWSGSNIQMIAKFILAYTVIMAPYFRFSYWLTA